MCFNPSEAGIKWHSTTVQQNENSLLSAPKQIRKTGPIKRFIDY